MPGPQVEIADRGRALPVPVVGQIEHVAAHIAMEGREDVCVDGQPVEIARGIGGEPPCGLAARLPGHPAAGREPQRIAGVQSAGHGETHFAQLHLSVIEMDVPVTQQRREVDSGAHHPRAPRHDHYCLADAGVSNVNGEPARQEFRRAAMARSRRRPGRALDFDIDVVDRRFGRVDGLPQERFQLHPGVEAADLEVHPILVDLQQAGADAAGDRAADILYLHANLAVSLGQVADDESQAALCVDDGVERSARQTDHDQQEDGGGEQQKATHWRLPRCHSFGEKLM